jgi:hypothetical protein
MRWRSGKKLAGLLMFSAGLGMLLALWMAGWSYVLAALLLLAGILFLICG